MKAFIPSEILFKYLGGNRSRSILTATLVGIPLPLYSCGVIPTGLSLYDQGASKPSTLAFLIATPATSITSIFLVFGMLGWRFAIAEIATSFCVAVITGLLAGVVLKGRTPYTPVCSPTDQNLTSPPLRDKMKTVFRYGFIDMIDNIGLCILIGLIGAGIIAAMIPSEIVGGYLGGSAFLTIMVLLATPMYICFDCLFFPSGGVAVI
ncbi:MAG: putative permease [Candidatus Methanolliviera sp. GoM_asphalt]|nr:MAG: putative permease [Candidatus Methanolliviera sp. GoM_asphalt]